MAQSLGATVTARVWHTLITLAQSPGGPVAIQHAPFLARGDLGGNGEPLSSILYPSGMRAALLGSFEHQRDDFTIPGNNDAAQPGYQELACLRQDLTRFGQLAPMRQAQVLACLNCITEQGVVVRLAPDLPAHYFSDPAGCCALYEAARAFVRILPEDRQSRTVLSRLSRNGASAWIRGAAAVQLGAASIRIDGDLTAAASALEAAEDCRGEVQQSMPAFCSTLLDSRLFRLRALFALRNKDFTLARHAMENALSTAETLMSEPPEGHPYLRLVASENRKIVLESHLKAASGSKDLAGFVHWATRLMHLDPDDSYTWKYIAIYATRCGLVAEATLALAGLTSIGGLGVPEVLASLQDAPGGGERSDELAGLLRNSLADLHRHHDDQARAA
jgi:hypothetical protein